MNHKALIVVATLVALLVLGAGAWIWSQSTQPSIVQEGPNPVKAPTNLSIGETSGIEGVRDLIDGEYAFTPVDTSDWQTYRNEEAGFEVKIPGDFEKTEQGFTLRNPSIGNPDGPENTSWFLIGVNSRLKHRSLSNIPHKDLFDPLWVSYVALGNVDVSVKQKGNMNNVSMVSIKSILEKEPSNNEFGGWIEGAYEEEAFFQCGLDVCSVRISSHQFSQEKQVLFYTILSTLRLIQ